MNEVAEPTAHTSLAAVKPATRLAEIRDRAELAVNRPSRVPPAVQALAGRLRRILVLEARVHISDEMVIVVVAHHHLLDLAELAHLAPEVLVESVEVVLQLRGRHARFAVVGGILIEVGEEDGLAVGGLDVFARAAVAVAAGADFVVEGAVDLVLLRAEDGGEIVGHDGRVVCVVSMRFGCVGRGRMLCVPQMCCREVGCRLVGQPRGGNAQTREVESSEVQG